MDLPTYTSIWRIEKRLYKLYDFRLPMPLPVGQIIVFAGITVPYVVLLTALGLPVNHNVFWLYVLPPGALTWLATRPVLESKRLPELIISQLRYLGEPRTWCRMVPLAEKDDVAVAGRVWRRRADDRAGPALPAVAQGSPAEQPTAAPDPAHGEGTQAGGVSAAAVPVSAAVPARERAAAVEAVPAREPGSAGERVPAPEAALRTAPSHLSQTVAAQVTVPAAGGAGMPGQDFTPASQAPPASARAEQAAPAAGSGSVEVEVPGAAVAPAPAAGAAVAPAPATDVAPVAGTAPAPEEVHERPEPSGPVEPPPAGQQHAPVPAPVVIVPKQRPARPPRTVEQVLGGPAGHRGGWRDRVVVVPGGRGPGRADDDKRDKVRASLPLHGHRLVMVLGCSVGAGQTVTTLMLGDLLSTLRHESVAVLDLNPGPASLTALARTTAATVHGLLAGRTEPGHSVPGPREQGRLDVISHDQAEGAVAGGVDHQRLLRVLASRYQLTLADPGAAAVARVIATADELVLVAPASPDASRAVAMTWEWLAANGYSRLAANSIMVMNGLSKRSLAHAEQAELVVKGQCRAIVRVPWDDHLAAPQAEQGIRDSLVAAGTGSRLDHLRPPVMQAYTALAGVLISALADGGQSRAVAR